MSDCGQPIPSPVDMPEEEGFVFEPLPNQAEIDAILDRAAKDQGFSGLSALLQAVRQPAE